MSKHTPGPWRAEMAGWPNGSKFGFSIIGQHADPEAEPLAGIGVYRHRNATADYPPEVMEANAALLAAAPELLQALMAVERWMSRGQGGRIECCGIDISSVIDKASGR